MISSNPMRAVWKFPLKVRGETWIQMPNVWRALTAQMQDGGLYLWALVDPQAPREQVHVLILGTGWERDLDGWEYVATVQDGAGFVWHVFVPEAESL